MIFLLVRDIPLSKECARLFISVSYNVLVIICKRYAERLLFVLYLLG
jgi:hypothetical protein